MLYISWVFSILQLYEYSYRKKYLNKLYRKLGRFNKFTYRPVYIYIENMEYVLNIYFWNGEIVLQAV